MTFAPAMVRQPLVLIVDDDRALCDLLRDRLALDGVRSEYVNDGLSAVPHAFALRPQLIVLDVSLPELSGDQVFARFAPITARGTRRSSS